MMITYFDSIFFVILISLKIKKIHKKNLTLRLQGCPVAVDSINYDSYLRFVSNLYEDLGKNGRQFDFVKTIMESSGGLYKEPKGENQWARRSGMGTALNRR